MASKRITKSLINWSDFTSRIPDNQRQLYIEFKRRCDNYQKRVQSYPENPPEIDWNYYKEKIPDKSLVEKFQQEYNSLSIPYPIYPDNINEEINQQETDAKKSIDEFKCESDKRINNFKKELQRLQNLLPFNEMTYEDFRDAYPNEALDPINRPTFWPHNPEEQPGYDDDKDKDDDDVVDEKLK